MKTIDVNIRRDNINMATLKAEQNGEQNNSYYIMNKVETKELRKTKRDDLNGYQNTIERSI